MTANTKWTYVREPLYACDCCPNSRINQRATTRPGDDRTTIQILTVPQEVVRRGLAALASPYQNQIPPTPRIPYLPLPSPGQNYFCRQLPPPLFPIDLLQTRISSAHVANLREPLTAFTTITVHDAPGHVFCDVKTAAAVITTADFVEFLQHFVASALPPYQDLSPAVQHDIQEHFVGESAQRHDAWLRYIRGNPRLSCFPRGHDLLIGNTLLWMLVPEMGGGWSAMVHPPPPRRLW
ncbi:hypothetical protein C8F04DRAFT_1116361 [Mycena alexandri]|uniref:Uncharacterized protein n=1 Tax=Mycena alexandri TaxID=1745969 RepID=A0AAD6WZP1_9AGAR|nr:hypothetical protein C8F04DRAFT_1116361 [Mycena alexandri]